MYGRENTYNPAAGDGYCEIFVWQHAAQLALF
jgi:hypothetical protein